MSRDAALRLISESCEPRIEPERLDHQATLTAVGVDSLKLMHLVLDLEDLVGRKLFALNQMHQIKTVGQLIDFIEKNEQ